MSLIFRKSYVALVRFSTNSFVNYACESSNLMNHLLLSCEFLALAFFALNTKRLCFEKWDLTFSSVSKNSFTFGIMTPSQNGTPTSSNFFLVLYWSKVYNIESMVVSLSWCVLISYTIFWLSFFDLIRLSSLYYRFLSRLFYETFEAVNDIPDFMLRVLYFLFPISPGLGFSVWAFAYTYFIDSKLLW